MRLRVQDRANFTKTVRDYVRKYCNVQIRAFLYFCICAILTHTVCNFYISTKYKLIDVIITHSLSKLCVILGFNVQHRASHGPNPIPKQSYQYSALYLQVLYLTIFINDLDVFLSRGYRHDLARGWMSHHRSLWGLHNLGLHHLALAGGPHCPNLPRRRQLLSHSSVRVSFKLEL